MEKDKTEPIIPINDSAELLAALKKIGARAVLRKRGSCPTALDTYAENILALLAYMRRLEQPIEAAIIEKINGKQPPTKPNR